MFLLPALLVCVVLTGIHVPLGIHVLAREIIFLDIALAQVAVFGYALGVACGYSVDSLAAYGLALLLTISAAALLAVLRRYTVSLEAVIGVLFVASSAGSMLVAAGLPHGTEQINALVQGDILWARWADVVKLAALYSLVGAVLWYWRRQFWRVSCAESNTRAIGMHVARWDFFFYVCFALVITSSVQVAGVLVVFALLIVPALCGRLWGGSFRRSLFTAWGVGVSASSSGLLLSWCYDLPTGPSIVVVLSAMCLLAHVWVWKKARSVR